MKSDRSGIIDVVGVEGDDRPFEWLINPLGDAAAIVKLRVPHNSSNEVVSGENRNDHGQGSSWVIPVWRHLQALHLPHIVEIAPAFESLTVYYDLLSSSWDEIEHSIRRALSMLETSEISRSQSGRLVEIPVQFDRNGEWDLGRVADRAGMTIEQSISVLCNTEYRVAMIGFMPGFPYLAGLDPRLATPRLATPRIQVPSGAFAIGGNQAGIYPLESPGGWNIVGRSQRAMFQPDQVPPCWLEPGDRVRIVDADRFEEH